MVHPEGIIHWSQTDRAMGGAPPDILLSPEALHNVHQNFVAELQAAYTAHTTRSENKTSLPFYVHNFRLPSAPLTAEGELFEVLMLGGTDGIKALCKRTANGIEIVDKQGPAALPKVETMEQFATLMEASIEPGVSTIAINLANTLETTSNGRRLDGVITGYDDTRAIAVQELVGKAMGAEIEKHFLEKRNTPLTVSVAGDGLCQLLAARTQFSGDNHAFGVIGTGYNMGFLLDPHTFVDLDAASFDKFPMNALTQQLAEQSGWPFGKAVNGTHLYKHFNNALAARRISFPAVASTRELSAVSERGASQVATLARNVIDHAAQLVACQAAGVADFKGQDMVFVMDGSVFWKADHFKTTVEKTVGQLTDKRVHFLQIPDCGIIGAAQLIA